MSDKLDHGQSSRKSMDNWFIHQKAQENLDDLSNRAKSHANALNHGVFRRYLESIPKRYVKRWLETYLGESTPRKAMAMKCFDCVGFTEVERNIRECVSMQCSLWSYRPYRSSTSQASESQASESQASDAEGDDVDDRPNENAE